MDANGSERSLYIAAFIYTMVGGYLDAYCYVAHRHAFANAQTRNLGLLGFALANGDSRGDPQPIASYLISPQAFSPRCG